MDPHLITRWVLRVWLSLTCQGQGGYAHDVPFLSHVFISFFAAGRSSSIVPPREYQITLYCDSHSPYGFGLRVVGAEGGYARVLWICPGGPAEQAGIRVGDKVGDWMNEPAK